MKISRDIFGWYFTFSLSVLGVLALAVPFVTFSATTPSLGAASTYGVLSSTYTNTTVTTINGDVGFTTPPAVAPGGVHVNYGSNAPYAQAGIDQATALGLLNAQSCDFSFIGATDLSLEAQPLTPGVYCFDSAVSIGTSGVILSGAGTFIFRVDGSFDTVAGSDVVLTNGADACDIFWTPTSATTFGANSNFIGTVIDDAGITVGANTVWTGRALSFGETVTTDTTTITNSCLPEVATLTIIKQVVNTGGGTGVASDFTLHVLLSGDDITGSPFSGFGATGTVLDLYAGMYVVSEDPSSLYTQTFAGDCSITGAITVTDGEDATCTVINTFIPPESGRSSSITIDDCPDGDDSPSDYDSTCSAETTNNSNDQEEDQEEDQEIVATSEPTSSNDDLESFAFPTPEITNPIALVPALPIVLPPTGSFLEEKSSIRTIAMIICITILMSASAIGLARKIF